MKLTIERGRVLTLAVAILSLFMVACSGEDGEDGEDGVTGAPGSSSVATSTYTIAPGDWASGNATLTVPGLSKSIADRGVVAAYFTFDSLATDTIAWNPLPYSFSAGSGTFGTVGYRYRIGEVDITLRINNINPANFNVESYVRIVLIPSASLVSGVDHNNYEEVLQVYGLRDEEL